MEDAIGILSNGRYGCRRFDEGTGTGVPEEVDSEDGNGNM